MKQQPAGEIAEPELRGVNQKLVEMKLAPGAVPKGLRGATSKAIVFSMTVIETPKATAHGPVGALTSA